MAGGPKYLSEITIQFPLEIPLYKTGNEKDQQYAERLVKNKLLPSILVEGHGHLDYKAIDQEKGEATVTFRGNASQTRNFEAIARVYGQCEEYIITYMEEQPSNFTRLKNGILGKRNKKNLQ